ncbi:MAG: WYL domain-containing protein [Firmicutes bacterium]|nr:WYL domain-containing protein [Gammaproteobacteria bacterium]MCL5050377.1 WYL domain-containing protein [Bacillota bacterium]
MSANTSRKTLTRQWELLKALPSRPPGYTARELTERLNLDGFAVSKRQVERDLNELSATFAICCNDKSAPYGWYWAKDATTDIPGLSAAEALSMHLMETVVTPLLPASVVNVMAPRFKQAKNKLQSISSQSVLADWVDKVAHVPPVLPQLPPQVDANVLDTVQHALLFEKQLQVRYYAATKDTVKQHVINPLGLVQRGVATYLVGCVEPHQTPHLFAMQRMQQAESLDAPARVPEGFTLSGYLSEGGMQFSDGQFIQLSARIRKAIVLNLEESPLSDDQHITATESPDWYEMSVTVPDSWQLRWWVMSLGEMIRVDAPLELREEIKARIQEALRHYQ